MHVIKKNNRALDFMRSIEGTWKSQEAFSLWLVKKLHPKTIVDLGVHRGLSTLFFAYKNRGNVYGIDWFEPGAAYAEKCILLDSAFQNISNALRFNYVKNIHLIIGPFRDISKNWDRPIDLLHLNVEPSYQVLKIGYDNWRRYLRSKAVILVDNIQTHAFEAGRFFDELPLPKILLPQGTGLGIASADLELIDSIRNQWLK